ncbi:MAG: hypothetical protein ACE5EG_04615 [Thermoanaerobaculia bacterium]
MSEDRLDELTRELRRWAELPGALSPQAARTRVLAHLPERRRRPLRRLVAAGAVLTATVLVVTLLVGRSSEPISSPPAAAESPQKMIIHQLSSGTKLYIVMRPAAVSDEC